MIRQPPKSHLFPYPTLSRPPDPERDTGDLVALLGHLQVSRPVIVGMSQGARVALTFALRHPEHVSALVLDGPPDCFGAGEPERSEEHTSELQSLRHLVCRLL